MIEIDVEEEYDPEYPDFKKHMTRKRLLKLQAQRTAYKRTPLGAETIISADSTISTCQLPVTLSKADNLPIPTHNCFQNSVVLDNIFKYLDKNSLRSALTVSSHWNDSAQRKLCKREWLVVQTNYQLTKYIKTIPLGFIKNLTLTFDENNFGAQKRWLKTIGPYLRKFHLKNCVSPTSFRLLHQILTEHSPQLQTLLIDIFESSENTEATIALVKRVGNLGLPSPLFRHPLRHLKLLQIFAMSKDEHQSLPPQIIQFLNELFRASIYLEYIYDYSYQLDFTCNKIQKHFLYNMNNYENSCQWLEQIKNCAESLILGEIDDGGVWPTDATIIPTIDFPRLEKFRNLSVGCFWMGSMNFLSKMPKLQTLELAVFSSGFYHKILIDVLFNSEAQPHLGLSELDLSSYIFNPRTAKAFVKVFPNLSILRLSFTTGNNSTMDDDLFIKWIRDMIQPLSELGKLQVLKFDLDFKCYQVWRLINQLAKNVSTTKSLRTIHINFHSQQKYSSFQISDFVKKFNSLFKLNHTELKLSNYPMQNNNWK